MSNKRKELDDSEIIQKIQESLQIREFSLRRFGCFVVGTLAMILMMYVSLHSVLASMGQYSATAATILAVTSLGVGVFLVFVILLLGAKFSHIVRTLTYDEAARQYKHCEIRKVNIAAKKRKLEGDDQHGNQVYAYLVKYEHENRSTTFTVDEETYNEMQEGDEYYILLCPAEVRNKTVIKYAQYAYRVSDTKYSGTLPLRESRLKISQFT